MSSSARSYAARLRASFPNDYLIPSPYPNQFLFTVGAVPQRQSFLNVSGDGGRSVFPEHGLSTIRLRLPLGDAHFVSRRSRQQLGPLDRLQLQAQRFHHLLRDLGRPTLVQNRLG